MVHGPLVGQHSHESECSTATASEVTVKFYFYSPVSCVVTLAVCTAYCHTSLMTMHAFSVCLHHHGHGHVIGVVSIAHRVVFKV